MDSRKIKILNTIIKSYIDSNEPVGSKILSQNKEIGVSAATIRNEMNDLENLGYLHKIHTSSGRVPSNSGYRLYVDALLSNKIPFERGPVKLIDKRNIHESGEFENVIKNATKMLSTITNYTAMALLPELETVYLKYINIVHLSPRDLMIIYIYNTKEVFSDSISLRSPIDKSTIDIINSLLASTLIDLSNGEVLEVLKAQVYEILRNKHYVLNEIIPVIEKTIRNNSKPRLIAEGLSNIFVFNKVDNEENRNLVDYIKKDNPFINVLNYENESDLQIYIGEEIGIKGFENFSLISLKFKNSDGVIGKIAVLGPNSMKYDNVISDIVLIGRYINGNIERR